MSTLIAYPGEFIKAEFYFKRDIIFLDEAGWWVYDEVKNVRILSVVGFSKQSYLSSISPNGIRDMINWWSPIWTRWVSGSFKYELYRIKSIEIVDSIYNDLISLDIQCAVLCTAVPHHIDSSLLQISLAKLNLPQVFLYSNVIDGRLIPLVQYDSIFNREVLVSEVSEFKYEKSLDLFVENKKAGNSPLVNTNVSGLKKSYLFSILFIFIIFFKNLVFRYLFYAKLDKRWASFFKEINFFESICLMRIQRKYLKTYILNKLSYNESSNFIKSEGIKLIIAAHYQPEATSFPEGGNFSNHIEILMKIRSLGHTGIIGYKEHPATWMYIDKIIGSTRVGIYRSKEYFQQLLKLGCIILDENFPLPLTGAQANNYLPITISGSIAIERSLMGFHTIVAGEPWFKGIPGVISLNDICSLNDIPDTWLRHSNLIENEARTFLLSKMNYSTITNILGVGSGVYIDDPEKVKAFRAEFVNLLKVVKNLSVNR